MTKAKAGPVNHGPFAQGARVMWFDGNSHLKIGRVAEVGGSLYWVQPDGTKGERQRKEFKKANCILIAYDGVSVAGTHRCEMEPAAEPQTYVARAACGCVKGCVVERSGHEKETANWVGSFVRRGLAVERLDTATVRAMDWKCARHTKQTTPGLPGMEGLDA